MRRCCSANATTSGPNSRVLGSLPTVASIVTSLALHQHQFLPTDVSELPPASSFLASAASTTTTFRTSSSKDQSHNPAAADSKPKTKSKASSTDLYLQFAI